MKTKTSTKVGGGVGLMVALLGSLVVYNEGMVLHSYPDPIWGWNVPTACAGDTGPHIQKGVKFTLPQCMSMMTARHYRLWDTLEPHIKVSLRTHQAVAIMSLADNVGAPKVISSTLLAQVNAGQPPSVYCDQFLRWTYSKGVNCALAENKKKCGGLVTRRYRERHMCLGDVEQALAR